MSQPRLDLSLWKARIISIASPIVAANSIFGGIPLSVIGPGERDLKQTFGKIYPVVYLLRQRVKSTNSGGATRGFRQTYDVFVETTCVAEKFADGVLDGEVARQALCDAVFSSLFGWQPPDATLRNDLNGYTDGDPADVVNYGLHDWHTQLLFQGAP